MFGVNELVKVNRGSGWEHAHIVSVRDEVSATIYTVQFLSGDIDVVGNSQVRCPRRRLVPTSYNCIP